MTADDMFADEEFDNDDIVDETADEAEPEPEPEFESVYQFVDEHLVQLYAR
ncbi:DUF4913 domain-containing protein, partial [Streptomyces sp. SID10244]|nr:DUF4913 domain-containing protein [Streptomyces sp. SID10244]